MTKEILLHKLTGTETPKHLTAKEMRIVDLCLKIINDCEEETSLVKKDSDTLSQLAKAGAALFAFSTLALTHMKITDYPQNENPELRKGLQEALDEMKPLLTKISDDNKS